MSKHEGTSPDLPCDLIDHLSAAWGLDPKATLELLGAWLVSYEPRRRRRIEVLSSEASLRDQTFSRSLPSP